MHCPLLRCLCCFLIVLPPELPTDLPTYVLCVSPCLFLSYGPAPPLSPCIPWTVGIVRVCPVARDTCLISLVQRTCTHAWWQPRDLDIAATTDAPKRGATTDPTNISTRSRRKTPQTPELRQHRRLIGRLRNITPKLLDLISSPRHPSSHLLVPELPSSSGVSAVSHFDSSRTCSFAFVEPWVNRE